MATMDLAARAMKAETNVVALGTPEMAAMDPTAADLEVETQGTVVGQDLDAVMHPAAAQEEDLGTPEMVAMIPTEAELEELAADQKETVDPEAGTMGTMAPDLEMAAVLVVAEEEAIQAAQYRMTTRIVIQSPDPVSRLSLKDKKTSRKTGYDLHTSR